MENIINWIKNHNATKTIIIYTSIAFITYLCMWTNLFGIITDFNTNLMLDAKLIYTANTFTTTINSYSDTQSLSYLMIHFVDYIFILTFYPALTMILTRINRMNSKLLFVPILALFCDLLENIIIDVALMQSIPRFLGSISGLLTSFKFIAIFVSVILIIYNVILKRKYNE